MTQTNENQTPKGDQEEDVIEVTAMEGEILGPEDDDVVIDAGIKDAKADFDNAGGNAGAETGKTANDNEGKEKPRAKQTEYKGTILYGVESYEDADEETRAKMDQIIASINPYDLDSIMELGSEEFEKMGKLAQEIKAELDAQESFAAKFEDLQETYEGFDLASIKDKALNGAMSTAQWVRKNPMTAAATGGALVLAGPLAAVGVPVGKRMYDKAMAKRNGGNIAHELQKQVQATDTLITEMSSIVQEIPQTMKRLQQLGRSRVETYKGLSVVMGAAIQKAKMLEEQEIPAKEAELEETHGDVEVAMQLDELKLGLETLDGTITTLYASRTANEASTQTLAQTVRFYRDVYTELNRHLKVSVPQWQQQMVEAGFIARAKTVADTLEMANEIGGEMVEQQAAVSDATLRMLADNSKRGTHNIDKVVGVLARQNANLEQTLMLVHQRKEDTSAGREALSKALAESAKKRAELIEKYEGAGRLLASPEGSTGADKPRALPSAKAADHDSEDDVIDVVVTPKSAPQPK